MTTQANHKRNMRESSIETLNAEKWASLAWLDGDKYPASELTDDWKKVLFNQFHDLAAGSGIGVIYRDAQKDYDVVRWSTNEISADSLGTLDERVNTSGNGVPVIVYNSLGWERSGRVTVKVQSPTGPSTFSVTDESKNLSVPIESIQGGDEPGVALLTLDVRGVPALGYKVFQVHSQPPPLQVQPQSSIPSLATKPPTPSRSIRATSPSL